MKKIFLLAALSFISCKPNTADVKYDVGAFGSSGIDYTKKTHILVVGAVGAGDHSLGDSLIQSALARGQRYAELYTHSQNPDDDEQIVFIFGEQSGNINVAKNRGVKVVKANDEQLSGAKFLKELLKFNRIASIDTFSHSSPEKGFYLDDGAEYHFTGDEKGLADLKTHFTENAFVTLNGCNSGWDLAPKLSKVWNVPVSGALTGSNVQRLHSNGHWYFNDTGSYPDGGWATVDTFTRKTPHDCKVDGGCYRMKPTNSAYHGVFGDFTHGLPFYKFFCNFADTTKCKKGMASAALGYATSSASTLEKTPENKQKFEEALVDHMCPNDKADTRYQACRGLLLNNMPAADSTIFYAKPASCTQSTCTPNLNCSEKTTTVTVTKEAPIVYVQQVKEVSGFMGFKKKQITYVPTRGQPITKTQTISKYSCAQASGSNPEGTGAAVLKSEFANYVDGFDLL